MKSLQQQCRLRPSAQAFFIDQKDNLLQTLREYKAIEAHILALSCISTEQISLGTMHIAIIYLPTNKNHRN
jgi:hypothetical protein